MLEKLSAMHRHYLDISNRLADPDTISNPEIYNRLAKERSEMEPIVTAYNDYVSQLNELAEAKNLLQAESDAEMRSMVKEEISSIEASLPAAEQALKLLLLPKDPLDARNAILEVRAGTGGDEASLFAGNLFNCYARYCNKMRWKMEIISESEGTVGGYKEVVAMISGTDVFAHLKYEAGTHRVQRVPVTESQGRIHTSACTVAVLAEAEDLDIKVNDEDIRIDTYRASGAGGQHINKTESAIRITHIPTGLVVTSQDERSQHKNKAKALKVLQSKLLGAQQDKLAAERAGIRKSMVGSGDRSERIRTYNFPQNRITDHRIGLTLHQLDTILETGELDELINALKTAEQLEKMQESGLESA